jgi:hypothetical protein
MYTKKRPIKLIVHVLCLILSLVAVKHGSAENEESLSKNLSRIILQRKF